MSPERGVVNPRGKRAKKKPPKYPEEGGETKKKIECGKRMRQLLTVNPLIKKKENKRS